MEKAMLQLWRVGRRNGRVMYAQADPMEPADSDITIGLMDTPELALEAVRWHNEELVRRIFADARSAREREEQADA